MPDLLIRNVPEILMERLRGQAERNHRSVQKEAIALLEEHTQLTMAEWLEQAHAFREKTRAWNITDDSTDLIRQDRESR